MEYVFIGNIVLSNQITIEKDSGYFMISFVEKEDASQVILEVY